MKQIFLLCSICLALSGCLNHEEFSKKDCFGDSVNLSLTVGEIKTRAPQLDDTGKGDFQSGDKIQLCFSSVEQAEYQTYRDYFVEKTELIWKDLQMPIGTKQVKIVGVYPYLNVPETSSMVEVDARSGDLDLLMAKNMANLYQAEAVSLVFAHKMHQIKMEYTSKDQSVSEEELSQIATSITALAQVKVDIKEGVLVKASENVKSEYQSKTGKQPVFIVVPQENNDLKLHVKTLDKTTTLTIPQELSGNKSYARLEEGVTVTIRLNLTKEDPNVGTKVSFTDMSISGWTDGGVIEGEVDL